MKIVGEKYSKMLQGGTKFVKNIDFSDQSNGSTGGMGNHRKHYVTRSSV